MIDLIGHRDSLAQIPDPLPRTLLLVGPEGVGKSRAALELARSTGVSGPDFQNLGPLTRETSSALVQHHATYPLTGGVKVSVADISKPIPEAVNAILKLLESPPEYSRIILHSDSEPLLTVRSRCFTARFGTLSTAEVAEVLSGLGVGDPDEAARFSNGRVSKGLSYARNKSARMDAERVLLAVAKRDAGKADGVLAEALKADKTASWEQTEDKRALLCDLLAASVRRSLSQGDHALAEIPQMFRLKALEILEGPSRPALRARSAVYVLLAG